MCDTLLEKYRWIIISILILGVKSYSTSPSDVAWQSFLSRESSQVKRHPTPRILIHLWIKKDVRRPTEKLANNSQCEKATGITSQAIRFLRVAG